MIPLSFRNCPIYAWVDNEGNVVRAGERDMAFLDLQRATFVVVGPNAAGKFRSTKDRYEDSGAVYPNQSTAWVSCLGKAARRKAATSSCSGRSLPF